MRSIIIFGLLLLISFKILAQEDSVQNTLYKIAYCNVKDEKCRDVNTNYLMKALDLLDDNSIIKYNKMADLTLWIKTCSYFLKKYQSVGSNFAPIENFTMQGTLAGVYVERGILKYNNGDYNGAINDIKKSADSTGIKIAAVGLYDIGLCYFQLNDLNDACKYMSDAGEQGNNDAYKFIKEHCDFPIK